ncbi:14962_t:CDS:2, partial [Acaulospora colombiana]
CQNMVCVQLSNIPRGVTLFLADLCGTIEKAFPDIMGLLEDSDAVIRKASLEPGAIRVIIPLLSRLLGDQDNNCSHKVWSMVLEFVVEVPFVFDTHCNAKSFYSFIQAHGYSPDKHRSSYLDAEKRRRSLRLVCRTWAKLMNRPNPHWAVDHALSPSERNFDHIKRLDLGVKRIYPRTVREPLTQQRRLLGAILKSHKSLSSITHVCICISNIPRFNEEMISFLPHVRNLPHLQTLTYIDPAKDLSSLGLLELCYPRFANLTGLYIKAEKLHGSLRLERLESLYLDIESYDPGQWSFPALRHLALKKGSESFLHPYGLNSGTSPLAGIFTQLQLLFFLDPYLYTSIDESFWEAYPHLENLGVSSNTLAIQSKPPHGHPLNQIRLA